MAFRDLFVWLRGMACAALAASAGAAWSFGFEDVSRQAADLAAQAYLPPPRLPESLAALNYDEYRRIRFRKDRAVWKGSGSPFELEFFPQGRGFERALDLYEIRDGHVASLPVPADAFDRDGQLPGVPIGIAGFRIHYPLNRPDVMDEAAVFLGASYFRSLGAGLHYGLSARGIAVDTTGGQGEEFPAFTRFWFERPAPGAQQLVFYALLDGPRVAGAYQFTLVPGTRTRIDVRARLWLRAPVAMLGLAPMSSMFLGGENQPLRDDYRPEVHDSDGLQIESAGGEWIWRPLVNPAGIFVTSFTLNSPRGFGLLQRDRRFVAYEDLEAAYESRPSAWVEPVGDWGEGRVELLQFHTPDETHDNIAAYWVPAHLPPAGQPLDAAWRVHWGEQPPKAPAAQVVQSRRGHGYRADDVSPRQLQFHIDFAGPALQALPAKSEVEAVVSGDANTQVLRAIAYPNAALGGWRLSIDVERLDNRRALELRAFLRSGGTTLTETWSYALAPE